MDTPIPMTAESRAFFLSVTPPDQKDTSPQTDAFYAAALPLHKLTADIQTRVAAWRLAYLTANGAENDPSVYGKFERFAQGFAAIERELERLNTAARMLCDVTFEVDQRGAEVWAELGEPRP